MSTNAQNRDVTVIGLGLMGQALAEAFLRDGYATTVWNRTAEKADKLVAQGATAAGSVGEAVAAGSVVVVCVSDYDAVRELLDPLGDDALQGRILVNLTSGTSEAARDIARWAERRGAAYLDGAIMAIPQAIGTPDAVIFYSGPRAAFDLHEPVLRSIGEGTHLGDDHGLSSLHDVALLGVMWSVLNGFLQGAAMVGAAGVPASAFAPLVRTLIGTVGGWLPGYARQIDEGSYPALDATLDTHVAAMEHLVEESELFGVSTELPRFVKDLADRAVAAGQGDRGYPVLIEQFRQAGEGRA